MAIEVDAPAQSVTQPPRPKPIWAIVVAALVGLIVGSAATWWAVHPRPTDWFPVRVLEGNAYFRDDHEAFALTFKDGSQFFGEVGGADGRECIPEPDLSTADNIFMDIRIGVVRAARTTHQFGREIVVWIRCLGPATRPPAS